MSLQLQFLRDKINSARNLLGVVETMRGLAAVNIRRAEGVAVQSAEYARTMHLALHAALTSLDFRTRERIVRQSARYVAWDGVHGAGRDAGHDVAGRTTTALLITTDMGLCGQFNERIIDYALDLSREHPGTWRWIVVGLRGWERLRDTDIELVAHLDAPGSVEAIPTTVAEAFVVLSGYLTDTHGGRLLVVHNRPDGGTIFAQRWLQLAPFEPERWLTLPEGEPPWKTPPMTSPDPEGILPYLVREQVYIDLFQAFIQSFAAENAARLSSMRNATDNIDELLAELELQYRRERQDVITNELMELLGGVEAVVAAE